MSLGFGGEGSNPDRPFQPVTMESWKNKSIFFFYHSRKSGSIANSTIFRHALFPDYEDSMAKEKATQNGNGLASTATNNNNATTARPPPRLPTRFKHQPVSIGFDIPYEQWFREFMDSKFCLVIRGDTPGSRSMTRAIRAGCMPLIVSDSLPAYQPLYSKTVNYSNFALLVKEDDFLDDPFRSLDNAVSSLSPTDLRNKVEGLRLMQRMVTCDQPDSLFVPAFSREIVQTMSEGAQG